MPLEMKIFLTSAIVTLLGYFAFHVTEYRSISACAWALVFLAGLVGMFVAVLLLIWS